MLQKSTLLEANVAAKNLANKTAMEFYPKLAEVYLPFVGCKILKQGGDIIKKISQKIKDLNLPNNSQISFYRYSSRYSLTYNVKACIVYDCIASYSETSIYLGPIENGYLKELIPNETLRTDYTVEEVMAARELVKQKEKEHRDALSKLYPFDLYDR